MTFTSAAAVRSFAALYGEEQVADLLAHTTVATVGPAATEAVRRLGVEPAIVPAMPSIPGARGRHPRALPVARPAEGVAACPCRFVPSRGRPRLPSLCALAACSQAAPPPPIDLLVTNARIIDGTGRAGA